MEYPIVTYARKIGKNTAEFTAKDLEAFTKWWMKQPRSIEAVKAIKERQKAAEKFKKESSVEATEEQRAEYYRDVEKVKQWRQGKSKEEVMAAVAKVLCSMELEQADVDALLWALGEIFENYDLTGTAHEASLLGLKEALEGV